MQTENVRISTIARHYDWLREQGHNHTAIIDQLKQAGDAKVLAVLDKFDAVERGGTSFDKFFKRQIGELTKIIDHKDNAPSGRVPGYMAALSLKSSMDELGAKIRTHLMSKFGYLGALCLVGLFISTVYEMYVYPQLANMLGMLGHKQPTPFGMLGELGNFIGYPLIFGILSLATVGSYLIIIKSTYELTDGRNLARPLHWVPGISKLNHTLKHYLFIGIQHVCARNGLNAADSLQAARKHTGYDDDQVNDALAIAWELDTLEREFAHQRNLAHEQVESALYVSTRIVTATLTVIIFVMLATMITNFYMPIFMIGTTTV